MDFKLSVDLHEELNDYQKELVQKWQNENERAPNYSEDEKHVHDDFFAHYNNGDTNAQRVILPAESFTPERTYHEDIAKHLHDNGGWTIHDYRQGIATRKLVTKKGFVKPEFKSIGTILKDTGGDRTQGYVKDDEGYNIESKHGYVKKPLSQIFAEDPIRSSLKHDSNEMQLVISRHPHDVAGMTSGREWENASCMRLPRHAHDGNAGCNYRYVQQDLKHHTIVAYLTKKGDDNIEKPVSRLAIKKFTNPDHNPIWRSEYDPYGSPSDSFREQVHELMKTHYPAAPNKEYIKHNDLYNDSSRYYNSNSEEKFLHGLELHKDKYSLDDSDILHHNEVNGKLHSVNDEPSVVYHHGDYGVKGTPYHKQLYRRMWHQNDTLHREDGKPAIEDYYNNDDGTETIVGKQHFQNGYLHDPKNGEPAITDDNFGAITHAHYKFGREHNGVMTGISKSQISALGITAEKKLYGIHHTDDEVPSLFEQHNHYGTDKPTIKSIIRQWHKHGDIRKSEVFRHNIDGSLSYVKKFNEDDDSSHDWKDSTRSGMIKTNVGQGEDGQKIMKKVEYEGDYSETPQNVHTIMFLKGSGWSSKLHNGPNGEPAKMVNTQREKTIQYYHDDRLHNPNGPASYSILRDQDGKLDNYIKSYQIHGSHTPGVGTKESEWHRNGEGGYGTVYNTIETGRVERNYTGKLNHNPANYDMHNIMDHSGYSMDGPNGEPTSLNAKMGTWVFNNQPKEWPKTKSLDTNLPLRKLYGDPNTDYDYYRVPLKNGKTMSIIKHHDNYEVNQYSGDTHIHHINLVYDNDGKLDSATLYGKHGIQGQSKVFHKNGKVTNNTNSWNNIPFTEDDEQYIRDIHGKVDSFDAIKKKYGATIKRHFDAIKHPNIDDLRIKLPDDENFKDDIE